MNKKKFIVEIGTEGENEIDTREVWSALVKYFVAFVSIDVKQAAQPSVEATAAKLCPHCNLPLIEGACPGLWELRLSLRIAEIIEETAEKILQAINAAQPGVQADGGNAGENDEKRIFRMMTDAERKVHNRRR